MAELALSQFHFLRPWWLAALPPLLALAWWYLRRRQARSGWERQVDPPLLRILLERSEAGGHRWLAPALMGALVATVLALAGPSWERMPQPVDERNEALVIVLDLSRSMSADDLDPSRAVQARYKIADVLRKREEGQTGLIVFAGDGHIVTPLTDDTATIENLLPHLTPEIMPLAGRNTEHGVRLARELFESAGVRQGRILLLSDAVRDPQAVARHAGRNFPISALGIGSREGRRGGAGDRDGAEGVPAQTFDSAALERLVQLSHGRYSDLTADDGDIRHLLETPLPLPAESARLDREFDSWVDRGYLLALLLLPLALLGFRRGALFGLCLLAVVPPPVQAGWWDGLWQNADRRGYEALEEGEGEQAARLFEDPVWTGVAHYRAGDYEAAEAWFATDATARGHYNRGNALARQGRLHEAIAAYDEALTLDDAHEDAAYNRELLEELLREERPEQQQEDGTQPEMARDGQAGEQRAGGDTNDGAQAGEMLPDAEEGSRPEPGELDDPELGLQGAEPERRGAERRRGDETDLAQLEEHQALEQWLRRVPDDPGGLLERKFRQETNRRLRAGELRRPGEPPRRPDMPERRW